MIFAEKVGKGRNLFCGRLWESGRECRPYGTVPLAGFAPRTYVLGHPVLADASAARPFDSARAGSGAHGLIMEFVSARYALGRTNASAPTQVVMVRLTARVERRGSFAHCVRDDPRWTHKISVLRFFRTGEPDREGANA